MKKEIYNAYETIKPDAAAKERMLANILNAAADTANTGKETNMKKQRKSYKLQIAAALAFALIIPAAGAYATNLFGLQKIHLGKTTVEDFNEPTSEVTEREVDIISLQGVADSPEAKACAEWTAFCEEYDKDEAIISQIGNGPTGLDEKYTEAYNCYTQEMADKIDEICEKYQLSTLRNLTIADTYEELCSQSGIGDVCGGSSKNVSHSTLGGYFYEDGTLEFEGTAVINEPSVYMVDYQFCRSVKGSFCTYILNVENINDYEQWEYTTACGKTVLLANSDSKALIIADLDDSFIVVNILGDISTNKLELNNNALEALADSFDFSAVN